MQVWIEILLTTYVVKFLLTGAGTPILYIARSFKFAEEEEPALKAADSRSIS